MYLENIEELRALRPPGEGSPRAKAKKLDFAFYWRAVRAKKWLIAAFTGLMTALAVYYALNAVPIYSAKATLLLESQKANIISIEELVSSEQDSSDYFGTQTAILKSRALAERVVRHLMAQGIMSQTEIAQSLSTAGSEALPVSEAAPAVEELAGDVERAAGSEMETADNASSPVEQGTAALSSEAGADASLRRSDNTELKTDTAQSRRQESIQFEEILNGFRDAMSVSPVANTRLVKISFEAPDPEFAALAANTVAEQYIQSVLDQRRSLQGEASEWMDGRIAQLRINLDESEEALLDFKQVNDLVDLSGNVGRLNEQQLLLANSELAEASNELSSARNLFRKIQNYRISSPEALETLPFVQNDVLVRSVKTELGQAQRTMAELRNRYGNRHPAVIDAQSRLQSLRSTLNGHIERTVATFESDYQLLQQRVTSLSNTVSRGKQSVQLIGQQKITLDALEREVSANREQYNKLFDRITEIRTADGLDEANAVVAETAWVPTKPIKPNKKLLIAAALIASLLLSAAVACLLEYLDDTISSKDDVERRLKSRLLGVLPLINRKPAKGDEPLPLTPLEVVTLSDTYSEAVNTCRTALTIAGDKDLKVILVTSSIPNEGKSSVALNLAHSFGKLERTLLIDCDLRRPSIGKSLGISSQALGLSSFMLQKASYKECIHRHVLNSFDCLTSGPVPDQPLEMISSAKFAKSIQVLKRHYDKIIIDSPPANVVSDALVLSRVSDGVLYVVKPNHTSIKLIESGMAKLADAAGKVLGVCVSQFDVEKARAGGGLDFHGFGVNYEAYGEYYRQGSATEKSLKSKVA